MTAWRSDQQLRDHFDEHGREMGFRSADEYDASAQDTLDLGTYFTFYDDRSGEEREGCYDRASGRFVVLSVDSAIISHYVCREGYIRRLAHNNYDG